MIDRWIKKVIGLENIVISTAVEKSFKFDFNNLVQRSLQFALLWRWRPFYWSLSTVVQWRIFI